MVTIRLSGDFIIQLHKNHVSQALTGAEALRFTESLRGIQLTLATYGFRALANCYLLTLDTKLLADFDIDGQLDILDATDNTLVVYTSKVSFLSPDAQQL
jgi:hypothetical protein